MINWSNLPKVDLSIAAAISLETAGFIGNKYSHLYGFTYMFSVVVIMIFMISLDAVKSNNLIKSGIPGNNIRPIESELTIENKVVSKQWFWQKT